MNKHEVNSVRQLLVRNRERIFERLQRLEASLQELGQHEIEFEEEAQKEVMVRLYDQLDSREQEKIEAIDLAMSKLTAGSYGICEGCDKMISAKRLAVLPTARLCHHCAESYERKQIKLPRAGEQLSRAKLPIDYEGLTDDEIVELIMEHFADNKIRDLQEIEVVCKRNVIYLDGAISSEKEHQKILQILTVLMGFSVVIDRLRVDVLAWERDDRTPGSVAVEPEGVLEPYANIDEADDDLAYQPPDWELKEF